MLMDSAMLGRLTAEVAEWAVGVPVRRVVQPRHDLLALELGRSGEWSCLLIDWSAEFCRIHLAREMPSPALKDLRMSSVLRRHLIGARLAEVTQVNFDRLVRLRFVNCERLGPQAQRTLIAELMGRRSNLILVDEAGTASTATGRPCRASRTWSRRRSIAFRPPMRMLRCSRAAPKTPMRSTSPPGCAPTSTGGAISSLVRSARALSWTHTRR